ncbi:MAG: phosphoglucomutase/phosphomannomutase family protein [Candidatus Omnitrophota bacterium]
MCEIKDEIKFGTDGWRGIISDNFTFENVRRVAQAIADYYNGKLLASGKNPQMAVGYDTRFLSEKYARTVSEVLVQNGISAILSDKPVPTPTVSFAVKHRKLDAGVMITASHNPADYNGIKIKTAAGGAAGTDITKEVERLIVERPEIKAGQPGKLVKADLTKDYINFLRHYISLPKIKNAKFRVLVDPMHGSGNSFIRDVLKGTRIKLDFTRQEINPSFGGLRPEPILENLLNTQKLLKNGKYDICLVLDGDADRIAAFTGDGEFINPQKVLGLLILHLAQDRKMSGGIVKTIVGSNMLDNIAAKLGRKLHETPVGFKYISELMINDDILVGGEEAGGMGFKNYIPERDGSLAGLLLLEMMVQRKKSIDRILKEMEKEFGRYYYVKDNVELKSLSVDIRDFRGVEQLLGKKVVKVSDDDGVKLICSDSSWLMFRGSGTEPIMRFYAESKNQSQAKKLLELGKEMILKGGAAVV